MLNDAHFHVGQFYDIYTAPADILRYMDRVKIDRVAISSTTVCEENYPKVLRELTELITLGRDRIVPVLWITPAMLDSGNTTRFLDSSVTWRAIKVHRQIGWSEHFDEQVSPCLTLAKKLNVPIIFHTGESFGCNAGVFENLIKHNPKQRFILAHSKPIGETRQLMMEYPNVWCDTSFQTAKNIGVLVDSGLENRILWGSDYPIPRYYYPDSDMGIYYKKELQTMKSRVTPNIYDKIKFYNFQTIWP